MAYIETIAWAMDPRFRGDDSVCAASNVAVSSATPLGYSP